MGTKSWNNVESAVIELIIDQIYCYCILAGWGKSSRIFNFSYIRGYLSLQIFMLPYYSFVKIIMFEMI